MPSRITYAFFRTVCIACSSVGADRRPRVYTGNRFRQRRDAAVFEALLEGLIAKAAKRGEVDLSLVNIDSTAARSHHDAAGCTWTRTCWAFMFKRRRQARGLGWRTPVNALELVTRSCDPVPVVVSWWIVGAWPWVVGDDLCRRGAG